MKSKFEPDIDSGVRLTPSAQLIDPEAYDASEQRFAASVEEKPALPRFVPDAAQEPSSNSTAEDGAPQAEGDENKSSGDADNLPTAMHQAEGSGLGIEGNLEIGAPGASLQAELLVPEESGS